MTGSPPSSWRQASARPSLWAVTGRRRRCATEGFATLLYDHAGFGTSGGEPRQEVNPWRQVHGYRSAVSFLSERPEIDASRIAVWGFSYSGSIALSPQPLTSASPRPSR